MDNVRTAEGFRFKGIRSDICLPGGLPGSCSCRRELSERDARLDEQMPQDSGVDAEALCEKVCALYSVST